MKNLFFAFTATWLFLFQLFVDASELSQYKSIDFKEDGNKHVVELEFDGPVDSKGLVTEYINQTIQLYIPGVSVDGKKFQEIDNAKLASFYSYQLGKKGIRTRIIYKKPILAEQLKGHIRYSSEGNKLRVEIDHDGVGEQLVSNSLPEVLPVAIDDEQKSSQLPPILFEVDHDAKNYSATEIVERELGEDFRNESLNDPAKKDATAKEEFKKQIDEELDKRSLSASEAEPLVAKGKIVKEKKGKRSDLDESQIPVLAGEAGKKEESRSPLMRVFMSFVVLLVAAIGMVLFTKWWSKHKTKSLGDNHIRVVTQHHLGPKNSIAIIRVAGESILIGVTDQNISMLKTLALIDDEIPEESPDNFEGTLNSMVEDENGVEKIKDRVSVARVAEENSEKDEFNYGQIKDMVATKLKKMRTL